MSRINFHIVTIFPEVITSYTQESIIKRAQQKKLISVKVYNLRDYAEGKHKRVDDRPYGGGPGMVLKPEPIFKAVSSIKREIANLDRPVEESKRIPWVISTDARGEKWSQQLAEEWLGVSVSQTAAQESFTYSKKSEQSVFTVNPQFTDLIIICGRYQGIDERVMQIVDRSVSIGPYILTGGELPALIMVDTLTRLIPNVLGDSTSPLFETKFKPKTPQDKKEKYMYQTEQGYPVYTRPEHFNYTDQNGNEKTLSVPPYLLTGNHQFISQQRGVTK